MKRRYGGRKKVYRPNVYSEKNATTIQNREFISDLRTNGVNDNAGFFCGTSQINIDTTDGIHNQIYNSIAVSYDHTFPWLSNISSNYQEHMWKGLNFWIKARWQINTSAVATTNVMPCYIMALAYNVNEIDYMQKQTTWRTILTKNYLLSLDNAIEKPAYESGVVVVDCGKMNPNGNRPSYNRSWQYSAAGVVGDERLSEPACLLIHAFNFSSGGTTVFVFGELWATYKVCLYKPQIPVVLGIGGGHSSILRLGRDCTPAINGNPLATPYLVGLTDITGVISGKNKFIPEYNQLGLSLNSSSGLIINFPNDPGIYKIDYMLTVTNAAASMLTFGNFTPAPSGIFVLSTTPLSVSSVTSGIGANTTVLGTWICHLYSNPSGVVPTLSMGGGSPVVGNGPSLTDFGYIIVTRLQ